MFTLAGISSSLIDEAVRESTDAWSIGNCVLYELCEKFPDHTNERAGVAKVWLIGRSYAAAIERSMRVAKGEKVEDKYKRVVSLLRKSGVDAMIAQLPRHGPRSSSDLVHPLRIHAAFLGALAGLTRSVPRSFASKYLHFHARTWFFIYDSITSRVLGRLLHRYRVPKSFPGGGEPVYRYFVARAWALRELLAERRDPLSPRELDTLLLKVGA